MSSRTHSEPPRLTVGTVRTGLLRHSSAVSRELAIRLLRLVPSEHVAWSARPRAYAVSPELLTGVDCPLPSRNGSRVRGVGTLASRATITGGRILQSSAHTTVVRAERSYRQPWSHYLARPGVVEAIGKPNFQDIADGFTADDRGFRGIETTIIADRAMDLVQASRLLDGKRPFAAPRTTLHWAFETPPSEGAAESGRLTFVIVNDELRTLRLAANTASLGTVLDFCEDLALHDWLLSTLLTLIDRAGFGQDDWTRVTNRIRPTVDHLLHLWWPGARVPEEFMPFWDSLDKRLGFKQQWEMSVNRIRDQLALGTLLTMLGSLENGTEKHESPLPRSAPFRAPADSP
ncbi:SCO2521 family protein [Actinocorallia sp. B10E7]|uniref:SCO2521 family protein n=1 Tax=Actinocorallia sp. B10E7 TaxID=3153558 RepID=UPI00325EE96B